MPTVSSQATSTLSEAPSSSLRSESFQPSAHDRVGNRPGVHLIFAATDQLTKLVQAQLAVVVDPVRVLTREHVQRAARLGVTWARRAKMMIRCAAL
jgi:hypothetical protein